MRHTSLFFKRPELNSEPVHFFTFTNNNFAFLILNRVEPPVFQPLPASTKALTSQKILEFSGLSEM